MNNTEAYYKKNSKNLIQRYDNANMSTLHKLLDKYFIGSLKVLDIGFGSGRDLYFLYNREHNIWGVDQAEAFVKNAQLRFPDIKEQFIQESLPFQKSTNFSTKFDAVICIAMWMHIKREQYINAVDDITNLLNDKSVVIISFSKGIRSEDERYFEDVDRDYLHKLFKNKGFEVVEEIKTRDSLSREGLTWFTVVYKNY